jgi:hypothetical protein
MANRRCVARMPTGPIRRSLSNPKNPHPPKHYPMKPIAILSDIHANLPALLAVLREVQTSGAGHIVFLGDIVGFGASPAECVKC